MAIDLRSSPEWKIGEGDESVERVALQIRAEVALLARRRSIIAQRRRTINSVIAGLELMFGTKEQEAKSRPSYSTSIERSRRARHELTNSCRQALMKFDAPVTAKELFEEIQKTSPAVLYPYKRPFLTVSVVVAELAKNGEIQNGEKQGKSRRWCWSPQIPAGENQAHQLAQY